MQPTRQLEFKEKSCSAHIKRQRTSSISMKFMCFYVNHFSPHWSWHWCDKHDAMLSLWEKSWKQVFFFVNKQWLIIVFNIIISSSRGNEEIFRAKKSKNIYKDERLLRGDVAVISARIFLNLFNYFSKINEIISIFKSIVN